jgi:CrcB protein
VPGHQVRASFPIRTALINVTGSLPLDLITGLTLARLLPEEPHLILGGRLMDRFTTFTTFSTASFETVRLVQDRRYITALANGHGKLVASVAASALGLWIPIQL